MRLNKGVAQSFKLYNLARIFITLSWYDISISIFCRICTATALLYDYADFSKMLTMTMCINYSEVKISITISVNNISVEL